MQGLLGARLLVVTGKGGVGKTTVAAALGLAAARAGKRTVVCEVGEQERITEIFGHPPADGRETVLAPGLHGVSVHPEQAKEEWLRHQLHTGALAGVLGHSRIFQGITAAAPGLTEVITIGKVWELAQLQRRTPGALPYDLAILDAPATGAGLALLRAPRTYKAIAKVGTVGEHAAKIDAFISNPSSTAVVAVALPEEMPVNETIDLEAGLREDLGVELRRIFVNGVLPERLSAKDAKAIQALDGAGSPAARAALGAALAGRERSRAQRSQLARLRRATRAPVATLPFLLAPELERDDIEALSRELEAKL